MKRPIKASEIKVGYKVDIYGTSGTVRDITPLPRNNGWLFIIDSFEVSADDTDDSVFLLSGDNEAEQTEQSGMPWHEICGSYHHETANCWPCAEGQQAMSRLAAEFECYLSLLRARYQRSVAKFEANAKRSLASAITWNAEQALADEFTYNEISELAAKLAALETPEAARDALLRVIDYEREAFINHFRVPSGSGWTSNGVAGVLLTAKQQMLRNDGEVYKTLLVIIDDFIKKEIA